MFDWGDYCRCSNKDNCPLKKNCLRATACTESMWVSFSDFYKGTETCQFFIDMRKFIR